MHSSLNQLARDHQLLNSHTGALTCHDALNGAHVGQGCHNEGGLHWCVSSVGTDFFGPVYRKY